MGTGSGSETRASSSDCADERTSRVTNDILRLILLALQLGFLALLFVVLYLASGVLMMKGSPQFAAGSGDILG